VTVAVVVFMFISLGFTWLRKNEEIESKRLQIQASLVTILATALAIPHDKLSKNHSDMLAAFAVAFKSV
jgi:hypothetical protein